MSTMLLQAVASGIALGLIYAGLGAGFSLIVATGRLKPFDVKTSKR